MRHRARMVQDRISGSPGRLTAACRGRPTVTVPTAEDLVAAVERTPGADLSSTALLWPGGTGLKP